jgi:predicted deacetylase
MTKRLQVLLSDKEWTEIQRSARRQHLTTAEWVRQALRAARRAEHRLATRKKLEVVRVAARHAFPSADVEQMLEEIACDGGNLDQAR